MTLSLKPGDHERAVDATVLSLPCSLPTTTTKTIAMLVCLVGPQASGKDTVASVLAKNLGFVRVRVGGRSSNRSSPGDSKTEADELHFRDADRFLDYATLHWKTDMVTTDLTEREDIEIFVKRPWFLTVAVEAGVVERWRRAVQRSVLPLFSHTRLKWRGIGQGGAAAKDGPFARIVRRRRRPGVLWPNADPARTQA